MKRVLAGILGALGLAAAHVSAFDPGPMSEVDITAWTQRLNEAAAIGVPHGFLMDEPARLANTALLTKVEAGSELTADESRQYRQLFQSILYDNQQFLSAFDNELTVLQDVAPETANNCLSLGIAGLHDHHDVSARLNFAAIIMSLDRLNAARGPLGVLTRIAAANAALKDLSDLIGHLGVAVHSLSVPYAEPETPWKDAALGGLFETMLVEFKAAQFETVNSPGYWAHVDKALAAYGGLVSTVQARIGRDASPLEQRIAGRFLSLRTLAPQVDPAIPMRRAQ